MTELASWVARFRAEHGRPPAVLHLGNIANNAWGVSRLLREAGVESDVFCRDLYDFMSSPEWEEVDLEGDVIGAKANPDWDAVDQGGYRRPDWFVQGPPELGLPYLAARRAGRPVRARLWRWALDLNRRALARSARGAAPGLAGRLRPLVTGLARWAQGKSVAGVALRLAAPPLLAAEQLLLRTRLGRWLEPDAPLVARRRELVELFARLFPDRADRLTEEEVAAVAWDPREAAAWRRLMSRYDLVAGYTLDPILPLVHGKRPYTAFEHGTLRDFTRGDDPAHRRTALAFNQADETFITNGDCLEPAKAIGITRFTPMLHPVDERRIRAAPSCRQELEARHGRGRLLLCPLRHDWAIKGTDVHIRALPLLRAALGPGFKLLMTRWGADLARSEALAKELGVDDLIGWIEPVSHARLFRYLRSVDALLDQTIIPVFGATAPEGIAAGVPVIAAYDPGLTAWLVPEPAPILDARTPEQVARAVQTALDPTWRRGYEARARDWIARCHSIETVRTRHLETYERLLGPRACPPSGAPVGSARVTAARQA